MKGYTFRKRQEKPYGDYLQPQERDAQCYI